MIVLCFVSRVCMFCVLLFVLVVIFGLWVLLSFVFSCFVFIILFDCGIFIYVCIFRL